MLQALNEMQDICDFPLKKIVYVMTDFTESNFKFWKEHPSLKPFVDSGQLDMAIFDAVNDETITLAHSNVKLEKGKLKNPICVVAPTWQADRLRNKDVCLFYLSVQPVT